MPDMISITEYAERNSRTRTAVLHQIQLGRIKSAVKQPNGRWLLNADEPYPEPNYRVTNGKYVGFYTTNERKREIWKNLYYESKDKSQRPDSYSRVPVYSESGAYIADVNVKQQKIISKSEFSALMSAARKCRAVSVCTADGHLIKWDPVRKFAVITDEVVERSSDHE